MNQKSFNKITSLIFSIIFVLHGLRVVYQWDAGINDWMVPMWLSLVALALSGFLAWTAYKLSR